MKKTILLLLVAVVTTATLQAQKKTFVRDDSYDEIPHWFLQPSEGEYVGVSLPFADEALAKIQAGYTALLSYMVQHDITGHYESITQPFEKYGALQRINSHIQTSEQLRFSLPEQYHVSRTATNKYGEVFVALRNVSEDTDRQTVASFSKSSELSEEATTGKYSEKSYLLLGDENTHFSFDGRQEGTVIIMDGVNSECEEIKVSLQGKVEVKGVAEYFVASDDDKYTYRSTGERERDGKRGIDRWAQESLQHSLGAAYLISLLRLLSDEFYWSEESAREPLTIDEKILRSSDETHKRKATPIPSMAIVDNAILLYRPLP
jgi:hypothetical protein